ncbi:O-acetylhomoserine aminocarboxypropyltransferase/cysteine synthase family protein [Harryflintia acetispora]|uniref:O-acetylhomoserine aminocarboxypropyltransferase/cysteine synthase family protein n=1 Tax=Harryflintia acetispora TaxID=1849041 RepID=UPI00189766AB|nr:O-acetylhomoserine aminocarboxypropyltransferase/cysteine synthase family protein [Harryflintia acetispora]
MAQENWGFDTRMIHAGQAPDADTHSAAAPIYQTTAYTFNDSQHAKALFELKEAGNIYSRLGNPTVDLLERRVADLDGGVGALAVSSGHAAIFQTILNLAEEGDEIVSSICIYGGAINMLDTTLRRLGIKVTFVDPDDLGAWEAAINERTRLLFVEGVGNPNCNVADIPKIAAIAHKHGVVLAVDSTFTTPYLQRPIDLGADLVIHSATKFLGGHGTSMAGVVVDSGKFRFFGNERYPLYNQPDPSYHGVVFGKDCGEGAFISRLRALVLRDVGACLSPFNAFLILQGIETLSLRMRRHCDNALAVAKFLQGHPKVSFVNYPSLEGDKYHALQQELLPKGAGGVFTFGLSGERDSGMRFIDSLKLWMHVANVGDARSLVIHPATTTHSQLSDEQLKAAGISAQTVRLSVGLEEPQDLIDDLDGAIRQAVR